MNKLSKKNDGNVEATKPSPEVIVETDEVKITATEINEDAAVIDIKPKADKKEKSEKVEEKVEDDKDKPVGRKFSVKNLKPYERAAYNFIREQYPHYDVEKRFEAEIRIVDSNLKVGKKLGMFQTKFKAITMYLDKIVESNYFTYSRAGAHLMSPDGGLEMEDKELHRTLVFLHEMTHAMQMFEGIEYNEVDTVRNELEYLKFNAPEYYLKMVPSQTRPIYRTGQTLDVDGWSGLQRIKNTIWYPQQRSWRYFLVPASDLKLKATPVWEPALEPNVLKVYVPKKKRKVETIA